MENEWFQLLVYFIIYSFLGWVMESIVRSLSEKKLINTGFLKGTFCPIYGIGSLFIILFLQDFKDKVILLFFISIVSLTAWEYIVGIVLEKIFKTKYWDYSEQKFNFQGRISLNNSLAWGILGILFVKFIHPFIQDIISKVDINILIYTSIVVTIIFIVDMITTIVNVKNIKVTLEKIEELNKEIKEKIKELKNITSEKDEVKLTTIENIQQLIENLKKKRNKIIIHLYRNVYRLKKAFPAINTKEIAEILAKKIDIKKRQNEIKESIKKTKKRFKG